MKAELRIKGALVAGLFALGLGACTTSEARLGGAAAGAGAGALIGGPIGAVAGGLSACSRAICREGRALLRA